MCRSIRYRHNAMEILTIESFFKIRGGYHSDIRDVYFIRTLGELSDINNRIKKMEDNINEASSNLLYKRISVLPKLNSQIEVDYYKSSFAQWKKGGHIILNHGNSDELFQSVLSEATKNAVEQYMNVRLNITDTIIKNITIKFWYWLDIVLGEMLEKWNERLSIKIVAENVRNVQEYIFYYMITLLGCDVMVLNMHTNIDVPEEIKAFSKMLILKDCGATRLKEQQVIEEENRVHNLHEIENVSSKHIRAVSNLQSEKTFEELAILASSIVMIEVLDNYDEPVATGSGIMIGKHGFILTNYHVIHEGSIYNVRIEDDEQVYITDEVIKYNSRLDMAIIRINRKLKPLPIYDGHTKVVRGQKVVAIGSPLGLFNSVSDGIISGFRNINDVDMIQFTAPISSGSSGGAILNMNGEVIGISTAGISRGQNINLAVGYENIRTFTMGFISY